MSFILSRHMMDEMVKQGIIDEGTTRVTIDCPVNDFVRIYVEKVGDKRLLSVVPPMAENGVEIVGAEDGQVHIRHENCD